MPGTFPPDIIAAARAAQAKWRVFASVSLAQWAVESAWGTRTMGAANNCFGLKPWRPSQPYTMVATHEVIGGVSTPVNAKFCRFASIAECFDAHGEFLNVNRRYLPAFSTKDGIAFAKAIAAAGYATDPNYAGELIGLIEAHHLLQYDSPIAAPIPREPAIAGPKPKTASKATAGVVVAAGGAGAITAAQSGHVGLMWTLFAAAAVAAAAFLVLHFRKKA